MAKRKKPTFYSVKRGRIPGIYRTWAECEAQTSGFSGAKFKGFDLREQAEEYLADGAPSAPLSNATNASSAMLSRMINIPNNTHPIKAQKKENKCVIEILSSDDEDDEDLLDCDPIFSHVTKKNKSASTAPYSAWGADNLKRESSSTNSSSLSFQHDAQRSDAEELNELQKQALDLIKAKKNVFVTGPAGTGKSFLLHHVLKYVRDTYKREEWVATASTGSAAIPLQGQTLHSFAGVGVPGTVKDFDKAWNKSDKWRELKVLIIDEISMISGEFLDLLSNVVSEIRDKQMHQFGGIQLIFCGDFLQLPPIPKSLSGHRQQHDAMNSRGMNPNELVLNRGFAFQSLCWRDADINVVELKEVFRQKNSAFIQVLHEIRTGKVSSKSKAFLAGCNRPIPPNSLGILPTVLYSKNINVTNHNMAHLDKLPTELHTYEAADGIDADDEAPHWAAGALWNDTFFKSCIAEKGLSLKEGAQVMLIKNRSQELVNGSRGQVVDFVDGKDHDQGDDGEDLHEFSLPNMKFFPVVQFLNGSRLIIRPEKFESDIVGLGSCFRKAIPLKLAWAVTVHKSQGLTLDYVVADIGGVFAEAQTYVALSRASDENGLEIRNFSENKVFANSRALSFYAKEHVPLWNEKTTFAEVDSADERTPQGSPDCLAGNSFVFSGELHAMPRYDAEALIQKYGGVTRTAVSGKTNFLVIGDKLEDGRDTKTGSKYRKAMQIVESGDKNKSNLKIIDKHGLFELIGPS